LLEQSSFGPGVQEGVFGGGLIVDAWLDAMEGPDVLAMRFLFELAIDDFVATDQVPHFSIISFIIRTQKCIAVINNPKMFRSMKHQ
jgi:hypothetical protein